MSNYAVIRTEDNVVDNVVVLDAGSTWSPPADHYIINIDGLDVGIDWVYDPQTEQWTPPPAPPAPADMPPTDGPAVL